MRIRVSGKQHTIKANGMVVIESYRQIFLFFAETFLIRQDRLRIIDKNYGFEG